MANKNVAIGCMLLGLIALIASGIAGIAFQSSREFVVATLTCNPEAEETLATDDNCVDNVVVGTDGEVCQIGSLGLFESDFTPECTYDTAYAIDARLIPQDAVDPSEFGVLFPAQNELGGLGAETVLNVTEFDNCEDYFALDGTLSQALVGAAIGQVDIQVDGLRNSTKAGFDDNLDENFANADVTFTDLPTTLLDTLNENLGGLGFPPSNATFNTAYANTLGGIFDILNATGNPFAGLVGLTVQTQLAVFMGAGGLVTPGTCGTGAADPSALNCLALGLTASSTLDNSITGLAPIPEDGYFSPLDGPLCAVIDETFTECTFFDFFVGLSAAAIPGLEAVNGLVGLLSIFKAGADAGALANFGVADGQAAIRVGDAQSAQLISLIYGKSVMIQSLKDTLVEEEAVPENFLDPAAAQGQSGFAIICAGNLLPSTCSFQDIVSALITNPDNSEELQAQLELGALLLGGCALEGITTLTECVSEVAILADFPGQGVPLGLVIDGVLGGLYGIENVSLAEALEAGVDACEDDELDAAAIAQAQVLVPPGVALVLVGAAIGVVALVVFALANKKVAKGVVVLGGVLSLVGAILVLVGLLGVQQAPIFASVGGGDGDIEDNGRLFSTGQGSLLALVTIGAGLVGGIVMTIGGCLLPTEDSDDVLAAKA